MLQGNWKNYRQQFWDSYTLIVSVKRVIFWNKLFLSFFSNKKFYMSFSAFMWKPHHAIAMLFNFCFIFDFRIIPYFNSIFFRVFFSLYTKLMIIGFISLKKTVLNKAFWYFSVIVILYFPQLLLIFIDDKFLICKNRSIWLLIKFVYNNLTLVYVNYIFYEILPSWFCWSINFII